MPAGFHNLVDKNVKTEIRAWRKTLLEILIIAGLFLIINLYPIGHSGVLDTSEQQKISIYKAKKFENLNELNSLLHIKRQSRFILAYTPDNVNTKRITEAVVRKLQLFDIQPFETELALENEFEKRSTLAGVVFTGITSTFVPKHLNVSIRFPSQFRTVPPDTQVWNRLWMTRCSGVLSPDPSDATDFKQSDLYIREGFLQLQHTIFVEWVQLYKEFLAKGSNSSDGVQPGVPPPDEAEPPPEEGGPQPGEGEPQPGEGEPQPGEGEPQPGEGEPQPGEGEPQPDEGGPPPDGRGPQPGEGGPQPGEGGPLPGEGGPQPGEGGPLPGEGGPQPDEGGPLPGEGGPQPGEGGPQPGEGGPQPGEGGPQPGEGGPQPDEGGPQFEKIINDPNENIRPTGPALEPDKNNSNENIRRKRLASEPEKNYPNENNTPKEPISKLDPNVLVFNNIPKESASEQQEMITGPNENNTTNDPATNSDENDLNNNNAPEQQGNITGPNAINTTNNPAADSDKNNASEGQVPEQPDNITGLNENDPNEPNDPAPNSDQNYLNENEPQVPESFQDNEDDEGMEPSIDYEKVQVFARVFRHHTNKNICTDMSTSNLIEFLYYFSFLYTFLNMLWKYGREHEENILVHHRMYGYELTTHWLAHIPVTMLHLLILDIIIVLIVKTNITGNDSFFPLSALYVLLFLILYNMAMIVFVVLVVLFFANAKNAVLFGLAVWLAAYALFFVVLNHVTGMRSVGVLFSFILFFNNAFGYGMSFMESYDNHRYTNDIWILMATMVTNIIVVSMLVLIAQYYMPGRYLYRLEKLLPYRRTKTNQSEMDEPLKVVMLTERLPSWHNFEFAPVGAEEFVRLRNVCTPNEDHPERHHLKRITMRAYKGEITVLLGHHSSGKTTVIRSLAGWWRPSTGRIEVMREDVYRNWEMARTQMDVCMPNNALFDLLTVVETLEYFVRIKTKDWEEQKIKMEVDHWVNALKPAVKDSDVLVVDLNFEQKRLLCLCVVLCGGTKVVLLDQPTMHMRAREVRMYNSILQKEKPDRAIILTTYAIDEAETVGDRIGIIYHGVLKAYGTPFFLKTKFGLEYTLILIRETSSPTEPITAQIAKYLPNTKVDNEIGNQLIYKLPVDKRSQYQQMLIHLEREREALGIRNISLVSCELSDVYALLGFQKNNQNMPEYTKKLKVAYLAKKAIRHQQLRAMFYKKLIHQAPNIIPIILITFSVLLILFLGHMSKVLSVPPTRYNGIDLGFDQMADKLTMMPDNCETVKISSVKVQRGTVKDRSTQSFIFTNESLDCLIEKYEEHLNNDRATEDKIGAVEKTNNTYTIWVNQRFFHSAPLGLNLMHNLLLQDDYSMSSDVRATVQNDPMPTPLRVKIHLLDQQLSHLRVPLTMGVIIPITTSSFILPLVEERCKHLLDLQVIAGLPMDIYWMVNFIWDFLTYIVYMIIYVIVMAFTLLDGVTVTNMMVTLLVLCVYGIPALLMTYLISMFFHASRISAFLICFIIQLITGLCSYVLYWDVLENNSYFFYIMSLSPTFSLLDGVSNIYAASKEQEYCADKCKHVSGCRPIIMCDMLPQCCSETFFKFEDPGILLSIVYMITVALIFAWTIFWITLRREDRKFHVPERVKSMHSACYPYDDPDVVELKKKIAEPDMRVYRQKRYVVDQLEAEIPKDARQLHTVSFALHKTECMCIYGTRHCGKTHLSRQMAGLDGFSFGEIYLLGLELKYDLPMVYQVLGWCPQDRGLFNSFQVHELFHVMCMIRGVPGSVIPEILRDLALTLDITKYMKKKIGTLTIDQRRKINIAVSLIAYNKVIIVDEPTTGLPAAARREIWNMLRYARYCNKTVICTTYNTMECQALADEVLIFDEGEMLAIGSLQYLRVKYSIGFYLEVKLKRDGSSAEEANDNLHKDTENLNRFMTFLHGKSELRSRTDNWFKFYIPVEDTTYSFLYGAMEKNKRRLNITEYLVSNGTMEDVMINILEKRTHKTWPRN